jgi:hypothetical protein
MALADDLRECLAEVLGDAVPDVPDDLDPVRFFRQWLAERNLGLVPIAEPASFDWPGQWIAVVDGQHAVVMFGSPSGVWLDPAGAYRPGRITAGWMLTPLDLQLPTRSPYGSEAGAGTVAGILVAPAAEAPLVRVDAAEAIPGQGLAGDRYERGRGTFSAPGGRGYELTLVEAEVLAEIGLPWEDARRNLVTTGISLNALVGKRFRVGPVECVGRRLAEPCASREDGTARPAPAARPSRRAARRHPHRRHDLGRGRDLLEA